MTRLQDMKVGDSQVLHDRYVVVRKSRKVWRLGEVMGDWLMSGSADDVARRAQIADVGEYQMVAAATGRPIRKATEVKFIDGRRVRFLERIPKTLAVRLAFDERYQ